MIPRQYESRLNKALELISKALTKTQTFIFKTRKEVDKIISDDKKASEKVSLIKDEHSLIILIDCTPYDGKHLDDGKAEKNGKSLLGIQPRRQ